MLLIQRRPEGMWYTVQLEPRWHVITPWCLWAVLVCQSLLGPPVSRAIARAILGRQMGSCLIYCGWARKQLQDCKPCLCATWPACQERWDACAPAAASPAFLGLSSHKGPTQIPISGPWLAWQPDKPEHDPWQFQFLTQWSADSEWLGTAGVQWYQIISNKITA